MWNIDDIIRQISKDIDVVLKSLKAMECILTKGLELKHESEVNKKINELEKLEERAATNELETGREKNEMSKFEEQSATTIRASHVSKVVKI
jgi:hypothetical protein